MINNQKSKFKADFKRFKLDHQVLSIKKNVKPFYSTIEER
jgi:hypothetical protein